MDQRGFVTTECSDAIGELCKPFLGSLRKRLPAQGEASVSLCSPGHTPHWPYLPSLASWLVSVSNCQILEGLAVSLTFSKWRRIICAKVFIPLKTVIIPGV